MESGTQHSNPGPNGSQPLQAALCPFCSAPATVNFLRSRFRVACSRCEVHFELTAAAHKRAKTLPAALLVQIRLENARNRTPCISMPDIESCTEGELGAPGVRRFRAPAA